MPYWFRYLINISRCIYDVYINLEIHTNTPGWFTADIIEMVNQKCELTNIVRKNNSMENCDKLAACKKELRKMLRKAKQDLVITSLNDNHTNSRKFWKILNEDLGQKSKNAQDTCVHYVQAMVPPVRVRILAAF